MSVISLVFVAFFVATLVGCEGSITGKDVKRALEIGAAAAVALYFVVLVVRYFS